VLTKLMDISATVRLDSLESTVKLVSLCNFECSINIAIVQLQRIPQQYTYTAILSVENLFAIFLKYNTVRTLLSGHLLSGHPPLSGHFLKSRFICQ